MSRARLILLALLVFATTASGMGVVYAKYHTRVLFIELEELRARRDQGDIEWRKLELELGAFGAHARVEKLARERLGMRAPRPDEVVVVEY